MLHPDFPVIEGKYQMTDNWSVTLDQKHNRRIEEGSLVIWRPGFTIWTRVWNLKEGETAEERLKSLRADISKEATDVVESRDSMPLRLSYRLKEKSEDDRQAAFYGVAVSASGHVHVAIYFDDAKDLKTAQEIFASLTPAKAEAKAKDDGGQPTKGPEAK
ncbi:hypothetical protein OJ996_23335 [Luteolibacter sp. GHJ8]|uniref:DUF1795 domain-containing protein n=1 Tax=Luteolibacter rhizosphaerae TaxID=2989719 RepID=A0ABT3G9M5_9BACT|nr:hypothetical protein [Luteolibacter rhizosphaerae]MCW1916540.1 hypothetical protein [Luteolibacter rhizosphaerae]